MRQLSLGDGIDAGAITATYDNGVLALTIPLAEVAKPRRIEVQASTPATVISAHADQAQVTGS
jgi:HSP20 family protein